MVMQKEVKELRRRFRRGRAELFPAEAWKVPCRELMEKYTQLIDGIVSEIYDISSNFADSMCKRDSESDLAIVATGGYGRSELNPFSDVDIAFIPSEEDDSWVEAFVHMAFRMVMDVFLSFRKIRVGYSFRPIPETSTWSLSTKTALLDARLICGSESLAKDLKSVLRKNLSPLELIRERHLLLRRRRRLSTGSLYVVEPHLKEGPGSLRELHRGRWIYCLLLGVDNTRVFKELKKRGYLSPERISEVVAAAEWFWRARNWLHLNAGKSTDILISNYQDRIAQQMEQMSSQNWLSSHYRHAENLDLFYRSSVRHVLDGPLDVDGVLLENGFLSFNTKDGEGETNNTLKALQTAHRYHLPIRTDVFRSLVDSRHEAAKVTVPTEEESWAFLSILREGRKVGQTLRRLNRLGLIERFVDGFHEIMRFVPPDPAHQYTVGEHSLRLIDILEALRNGRYAGGERFRDLMMECPHFDVLVLAGLFHDAGKLLPAGDHCEAGTALVREASERLRLPREKSLLLELLVREHLLLVRTARLQDLKLSAVTRRVADKVKTVEALRYLYVFTYADTNAVAQNNWTTMDSRNLEELYNRVHRFLSRQGDNRVPRRTVEERIGLIRRKLNRFKDIRGDEAVRRHCDAMSSDYILNTPLNEIVLHIKLIERLQGEKFVLDLYNRPGNDYSEITLCTVDDPKPGLLAKITGILYGCDVDIHTAQVYTMRTDRPVVVDTLWVSSSGAQLSEARARRVDEALREVLSGDISLHDFLDRMGKKLPDGIPLESVDLRNEFSEEYTAVHILARDQEGLLHFMTRAISRCGLSIHSAKVTTWNALAENNFYVSNFTGGQIPSSDLPVWKKQLAHMLRGTDIE